eukprot:11564349-Alexandrium_andersonii.AAC.1
MGSRAKQRQHQRTRTALGQQPWPGGEHSRQRGQCGRARASAPHGRSPGGEKPSGARHRAAR